MVSIYMLCDPWSGEVRYVGLTRRLRERIKQYCSERGGHTPHLRNWLQAVERNPAVVVIEEVPVEGADDRERYWISLLRSYGARLINCTDGGEAKFSVPAEHKAQLRQLRLAEVAAGTHNFLRPEVRAKSVARAKARKGQPAPWAAKTIAAVNIARKGKPLSPARIEQMRQSSLGRTHTDETKQRMRLVQRRIWSDPKHREKVSQALRAAFVYDEKRQQAVARSAEKRRGVALSPDHRKKVSDGQKASWTPERRAAASAARKGKLQHPMTEEMKAKIRASLQAWYAAHPDKYPGGRTAKSA